MTNSCSPGSEKATFSAVLASKHALLQARFAPSTSCCAPDQADHGVLGWRLHSQLHCTSCTRALKAIMEAVTHSQTPQHVQHERHPLLTIEHCHTQSSLTSSPLRLKLSSFVKYSHPSSA
eukprot:1149008-Pelagomonas_calceolata.AAC.2